MYLAAFIIDTMKGPSCFRREMGDVVTVIGKGSSGFQNRAFADNFIAFDHGCGAVLIDQDPLPPQQGNGGLS